MAYVSFATFMDVRYRKIFWKDETFRRNRRALLPTAVLEAVADARGEQLLWAFLDRVLSDSELRAAAIEMLKKACYDPALREDLFQFSKHVMCRLARSPEVRECLAHTLLKLAADERVVAAAGRLALSLLADPQLHRDAVNLFLVVLNRDEVREKVVQLGCWWFAQILKDPTDYLERYPLLNQLVRITREQLEKMSVDEKIAEFLKSTPPREL